jgi:probable rRNA maturation factor
LGTRAALYWHSKIRLTFEGVPPEFPQERVAKAIGLTGFPDSSQQSISVRFVSSAEIANLHESFMGEPGPTNVLAFVEAVSSEIVICPQVAASDASIRGWDESTELIYLCVHGSLHAQGFDHQCPSDAARMRDAELRVLSELGIDTAPLEKSQD